MLVAVNTAALSIGVDATAAMKKSQQVPPYVGATANRVGVFKNNRPREQIFVMAEDFSDAKKEYGSRRPSVEMVVLMNKTADRRSAKSRLADACYLLEATRLAMKGIHTQRNTLAVTCDKLATRAEFFRRRAEFFRTRYLLLLQEKATSNVDDAQNESAPDVGEAANGG